MIPLVSLHIPVDVQYIPYVSAAWLLSLWALMCFTDCIQIVLLAAGFLFCQDNNVLSPNSSAVCLFVFPWSALSFVLLFFPFSCLRSCLSDDFMDLLLLSFWWCISWMCKYAPGPNVSKWNAVLISRAQDFILFLLCFRVFIVFVLFI